MSTTETTTLIDALRPRWRALWEQLQRVRITGDRDAVFEQLVWLYTDPARGYHTLAHILHCLTELDEVREQLDPARQLVVGVAIWHHDAVYVPGDPLSEEYSAVRIEKTFDLARHVRNCDWDATFIIERSAYLVRLSNHLLPAMDFLRAHPDDLMVRAFLDIDLAILGRPEVEFDAYEEGIAHEYQRVDPATFRKRRAGILREFFSRTQIYATDHFYAKYNAQARANLARSITKLNAAP